MGLISTVKNTAKKITGVTKDTTYDGSSQSTGFIGPIQQKSAYSVDYVEITPSGGFSTGGTLGPGGALAPKPKPSPGGGGGGSPTPPPSYGGTSSPENITPSATSNMTEASIQRLSKVKTKINKAGETEVIRMADYYGKTLKEDNKIRKGYEAMAKYYKPEAENIAQTSPLIGGTTEGKEYYVYQASTKKPSRFDILTARASKETGFKRFKTEATATGLGFATAFTSFGKSIINPIETTKGIYQAAKSPITTIKSFKAEAATTFKLSPSYAVGRVAGEAALIKSPVLITKGSDVVRTKGLTEAKEVVAPEYFKGQKFPLIKKGETAGELLGEFKKQGYGYTAAPKPLKGELVGAGSSELPGLYQAPKVSPAFLKVSGEQKVFSLSPIDTLRPSVFRTKTEFNLVKGVSPSQKSLTSVSKAKKFFETAPKGKSYVPFIKTEKESVIPYGTKLAATGKKEFFEFEGRKIPIYEYKTLKEGEIFKPTTTEELSTKSSSSYRSIGKKGKITSMDIYSASRYFKPSYSKPIIKSSSSFAPSSSKSFLPSSSKSSFSKNSFGKSSFKKSGYSKISSSKYSSFSRGGGSSTSTPIKGRIFGGSFKTSFNNLGRKNIFKATTKRRKFKPPRRTPSLFAIGTGLKSTKKGMVESSGFTIRPILISKRNRRK